MSDLGDSDDEPATGDTAGPEPADATADGSGARAPEPESPDLDAIERDLDAVDRALDRLAEGTYGTDEITGEAIPDAALENDPTARRA